MRLRDLPDPDRDVSQALVPGVVAPTILLIAVGLALSVGAGPLFALTDRAAYDLLETVVYTQAIFPEGVPQ